ncbi:hypothetical protein QNH47_10145 [Virgibacillus halodenitrificans]|uniref:ABC transporter permease n=1 Tax=Virgibacillus halodenitrificans TaxID=1482 RepID=UPI0024C05830|nr:FtsX-like permease family protein [Virgibacillus halodenitrificans]WHX24560.1 hypothetical protein QNH47_10145 [Virgibacillus halodenitrificans]
MISFMLKRWMRHKQRFLLSAIGVVLISGVLIYLFSLTESTNGTINKSLQKKWKSSYDLVVTPPETIFNENQLMAPNFLNGINGGISYNQYEEIKSLKEVAVAAPISVLGYTELYVSFKDKFKISEPGLYRYTITKTHDNGLFNEELKNMDAYFVEGWAGTDFDLDFGASRNEGFTLRQNQLIVGIDPEEEAKLVGLDDAVLKSDTSRYFNNSDVTVKESGFDRSYILPVLLNNSSFANNKYQVELERLDMPFKTRGEQENSANKLREKERSYLKNLEGEKVDSYGISGKELQNIYFTQLKTTNPNSSFEIGAKSQLAFKSSTLNYKKIKSPYPSRWSEAFKLESQPIKMEQEIFKSVLPSNGFRQASLINHNVNEAGLPLLPVLAFNIVGTYDIGKLNLSKDPLTKLPLQTYRPATADVVLGPNEEPSNPTKELMGSGSPTGLLSNPPNILTTVEAAEKIMGEKSISSIRIKLRNIENIGNQSQNKLENMKQKIEDLTGLQVTITRGSSPQPIITKIVNQENVLGWMEQTWIHLGASITILRETSLGYSSVLISVLLIGIMYVFATSYVSFVTNKKDYSIFLALGWKPRMLRKLIVIEAITHVLMITILALIIELILSLNEGQFNTLKVGLVALTSLLIYGFGILIPLIHTTRIKPYQGIQNGEISRKSKRILRNESIVGLVVNQILQRPGRNLFSVLAIALPSTLLSFYLFVSLRLDGVLYTSYLGEFVAVEVNQSHYLIMGAALLVSILTTAEMMWQNITERKNELALFKSIGWKNRTVAITILLEGAFIGFCAGLSGLILSMLYIGLMYGTFPWDSSTILLLTICIPTIIGMISSLFPAVKALKTDPFEVLKESSL